MERAWIEIVDELKRSMTQPHFDRQSARELVTNIETWIGLATAAGRAVRPVFERIAESRQANISARANRDATRRRLPVFKRTIIESPFAPTYPIKGAPGSIDHEVCTLVRERESDRNLRYARALLRDALKRGETPYASHLLLTQPGVLDDNDPIDRSYGIAAGLRFAIVCESRVFGVNFGMSKGMDQAFRLYGALGLSVETRTLRECGECGGHGRLYVSGPGPDAWTIEEEARTRLANGQPYMRSPVFSACTHCRGTGFVSSEEPPTA